MSPEQIFWIDSTIDFLGESKHHKVNISEEILNKRLYQQRIVVFDENLKSRTNYWQFYYKRHKDINSSFLSQPYFEKPKRMKRGTEGMIF